MFEGCIEEKLEGIIDCPEQRLDVVEVHVGETFIRITGVIKHDHFTWSTGIFTLDDLIEE